MRHFEEHAIGERFVIDHIIYEVRPSDSCVGCALCFTSICFSEEFECLDYRLRFGLCDGISRKDGQDVKFVQVGESDD